MRARRPAAALLAAACLAPAAADAVQDAPAGPGELHERVVSIADSTQSYALLLPPGYSGATPRPLLVVMDPRGRAVSALEIFRRPAARLGWIVLSSYDTRSDTSDAGVNARAVDAMLADAEAHLALDVRRVYLAGFSGTARLGWMLGGELGDHVAGLVGVGAGFPGGLRARLLADAARLPSTFAFWGGSGLLDFNYQEVRELDALLDELDIRHRVAHYPGGHAWLPAEQAAAALAWLELQAMRQGLRPADSAFVEALYRAAVDSARAAEAAGRAPEARKRWRDVAADFEGLRPVEEARERAEALDDHPDVRRLAEKLDLLAIQHDAYLDRMGRVLGRLADGSSPPRAGELASELELAALRRQADGGGDSLDVQAAGRLLEQVYVQASFYLPARALRDGDPGRALVALELAEKARPGRPRVPWQRARALAVAGRSNEAFAALDALPAGFPVALVADDPWLASLRGDPRWEATLARLR